ncbi:hypothetical protein FOA43_004008 [Brettanomyces nanus]|uniref:Partial AB-hydrolase lipase domain-containing protein n=1 Tax=Eeniella nana TaxID=13502 RepID=A0A875S5M8_EENNA|nr:uncharacterized protein FOA43_004008 [Brettanomyces nanus]QPG76616.1 hypothetical protein FOA43_004008 [Brettanomyces nanus]
MTGRRRSSSVRSCDSAFSTQSSQHRRQSLINRLEHFTSILLILLERLITGITFILPKSIISFFTNVVRLILNLRRTDNSAYDRLISQQETVLSTDGYLRRIESLRAAETFEDLCAVNSYVCENHLVCTDDGYLLTIHRLNPESNGFRPNGKAVFLQHGLLMNSEIWCVRIKKSENIPFRLCQLGYDVFLGNNRGNKYSCKQRDHNVKDRKFWDFSIDEFAQFDMPACINYVLKFKGIPSLSFIGFSQGCSQILASISIHKDLNDKIDKLVLIAPATTPKRLANWLINSIVNLQPKMFYFLFGRKIIMQSICSWFSIVYPPLMVKLIDIPNQILFDWHSKNIDILQKLICYFHLFSTTSVKCVVHWFQIIRSNKFQMYQDSEMFEPFEYPIHQAMHIPKVLLIYGMADSLVDIDVILDQLPDFDSVNVNQLKYDDSTVASSSDSSSYQPLSEKAPLSSIEEVNNESAPDSDVDNVKVNETRVTSTEESDPKSQLHIFGVENYEHLDLLWGKGVETAVIRHVLEFLGH